MEFRLCENCEKKSPIKDWNDINRISEITPSRDIMTIEHGDGVMEFRTSGLHKCPECGFEPAFSKKTILVPTIEDNPFPIDDTVSFSTSDYAVDLGDPNGEEFGIVKMNYGENTIVLKGSDFEKIIEFYNRVK